MYSYHDPSRIAEKDDLRSSYIRELVQESIATEETSNKGEIPKVIVQFWHDFDEIPEDVQDCLNSWNPLTRQGFRRILYDDNKARRFISKRLGGHYLKAFDLCHHPAMRCDYFRLCYILIQGGFYVDADEIYQGTECEHLFNDDKLKLQPLCYDTSTRSMISTDVFITKRKYSPDWIFYVNNNPIISPAAHPLLRLALDRATGILMNSGEERPDIQATTGPGNLTASLVQHSIASKLTGRAPDFFLMPYWEATSISVWPLSYRNDERNWRLWK